VHGLAVEDLTRSPALQTTDPSAQELEKQIRRVWQLYEEYPRAHEASPRLVARLREITTELGRIDVPYDEWSILYRECAQLGRALAGKPQLLAKEGGQDMPSKQHESALHHESTVTQEAASSLSTGELIKAASKEAVTLLKSEINLAKAEFKEDLAETTDAAKGLSIAAVCALGVLNLLLVAAVFGLATVMPGWGAALVVAGAVALFGGIAAAFGWRHVKHVKHPLERTLRTLKEDARWMKERTA